MVNEAIPVTAPGTALFPQFESELFQMICEEIEGLTDAQLDFDSDRWEWSLWSIRRNLSHMASGDLRWFWQRWGQVLFPDGLPEGKEFDDLLDSPHDRRLDEDLYWDTVIILEKLRLGMDLAWRILNNETVGSLREKTSHGGGTGFFAQYPQLFPGGVKPDPEDPTRSLITLEASFLHRYYEYITHLYNIQRLKRAQGLQARVEIPFEGYWAMPDWDRSEP
jgi:hypothetical protein